MSSDPDDLKKYSRVISFRDFPPNLPVGRDELVKLLLERCGPVQEVQFWISKKRDRKHAFVTFMNQSDATKALAIWGKNQGRRRELAKGRAWQDILISAPFNKQDKETYKPPIYPGPLAPPDAILVPDDTEEKPRVFEEPISVEETSYEEEVDDNDSLRMQVAELRGELFLMNFTPNESGMPAEVRQDTVRTDQASETQDGSISSLIATLRQRIERARTELEETERLIEMERQNSGRGMFEAEKQKKRAASDALHAMRRKLSSLQKELEDSRAGERDVVLAICEVVDERRDAEHREAEERMELRRIQAEWDAAERRLRDMFWTRSVMEAFWTKVGLRK